MVAVRWAGRPGSWAGGRFGAGKGLKVMGSREIKGGQAGGSSLCLAEGRGEGRGQKRERAGLAAGHSQGRPSFARAP